MLTKLETEQAASSLRAPKTLIAAHGVSVSYRGKTVVDQVNLAIHAGEIVTLIGPNGAGKTTLARALLGLTPLHSGRIERASGLTLSYVPQAFAVDPILPLTVRRFMRLSPHVSEKAAAGALEETGATHLFEAQLSKLSGGEFQRVLLARAIARNPDLLVLDEPAKAVDFAGAAQLYDLIQALRATRGCGILLISHDLHIVLGATDRVICLNKHICCEGVPSTISEHPEYVRLFGRDVAKSFGLYSHHHDHTHSLCGDVIPEPDAGGGCSHGSHPNSHADPHRHG